MVIFVDVVDPIIYFKQRASAFKIKEDFIERVLLWQQEDTSSTDIEGLHASQHSRPLFYQYSQENSDGLSFIVGIILDIDAEKIRLNQKRLGAIEDCLRKKYYFALCDRKAKGNFVNITVDDSKILNADISKHSVIDVPRELFEKGKDYAPAIIWMLAQYANK